MTIPERMVALQEMMEELIDAIYAEYRWTANVSHVSSTNVFTATNIINFDNSDFIVGQTVLFTDGYLGVVVEADNSVTPKQFTVGYYMQLKGDKGDSGINGTNGKDGLDALTYDAIYITNSVPSTVISFPTTTARFNRTPVVGDVFSAVFRGAGPVFNRSWLGIYKVISLGTGVANCSGSIVETTGQRGLRGQDGEGLVKRYMHVISYNPENVEDDPEIKLVIFSYHDSVIRDFNELIDFFNENHFDNADTSYPVTGSYISDGVVYNIWGIYYNMDGAFYVQYGDNKGGIYIGTPSGDGVVDVIIDLGK